MRQELFTIPSWAAHYIEYGYDDNATPDEERAIDTFMERNGIDGTCAIEFSFDGAILASNDFPHPYGSQISECTTICVSWL